MQIICPNIQLRGKVNQNQEKLIDIKANRMSRKVIPMLNISNIWGGGNGIATINIALQK